MDPTDADSGSYFGLLGLDVAGAIVEYPRGIILRETYAHVMQTALLAFSPAEEGKPHPAPWSTLSFNGRTVTTELFVPYAAASNKTDRLALAQTVVLLLKLWVHPGVELVVGSNVAFQDIPTSGGGGVMLLQPPPRKRHFALLPATVEKVEDGIAWTVANFNIAENLMETSPEFRLVASAFDMGQFHEDTALTMVSLWGALEAVFSPSTSELRFRVSALIASFLYPPGPKRLAEQRRIAKLYDKRSAAAHGKPKHSGDDLLHTFELIRAVLIAILRAGKVPTREEFEEKLFGVARD